MTPHYTDPLVTLYLGDCLDVMRELPDESVDSVCTDPPYGISFMGRNWDHGVPATPFWAEMFRILKPGGHLLSFGGTRTIHRIMTNIEDAGFEIRDTLMWIYASGFPKSLDVSKALDKHQGATPIDLGQSPNWRESKRDREKDGGMEVRGENAGRITAPATDLARKWEGWGTALKPAHEPIVMARKPLVGTVAANVTRYGTGALNIDGTRIGTAETLGRTNNGRENYNPSSYTVAPAERTTFDESDKAGGRWPSNILLSDPELFDEPNPGVVGSGATTTVPGVYKRGEGTKHDMPQPMSWTDHDPREYVNGYGDSGGYSRFFLIPKADRAERERGLAGVNGARGNTHPTVKALDLMRHLVRLVTPPGGTCLDPFLGSGTTALAASEEGFRCIGIEREAEYLEIAKGRLMATPMGLGLDVPAPTRRTNTPPDSKMPPWAWKDRPVGSAGERSWFHKTDDEEDAA